MQGLSNANTLIWDVEEKERRKPEKGKGQPSDLHIRKQDAYAASTEKLSP